MRRWHRQAARHTGRLLHAIATLALLLALLVSVGLGALAYRLSKGPIEITWLARRLEVAANGDDSPTRLHIERAALAWEGYRRGVDMPLDIRLAGVTATDDAGTRIADIPRAEVSLAIFPLLTGALRPRAVEIDGARLRLERAADGTVRLDLGSLPESGDVPAPGAQGAAPWPGLLAELARPAGTDRAEARRSVIAQLRRVRVQDAELMVVDRQLGATWQASRVVLDLNRLAQGGVAGVGRAELALGDQHPELNLVATLAPGGGRTLALLTLSAVQPAALARAAPGLAPLAAVDAPLSLTLRLDLGPRLAVNLAALQAELGAGHVRLGAAPLPLEGASLLVQGNEEQVSLQRLALAVRGREGGAVSRLGLTGTAQRGGDGRYHATLGATADQLDFADLPALWPEGTGGHARGWVTQNITAGTVRDAHVTAELDIPADLSDARLVAARGSLAGDKLTVHWLRPIGPIEHGQAVLNILDPDTLEIVVAAGQQRPEGTKAAPITIRSGRVRISGIEQSKQTGAIEAELAGSVAETVALLGEPRLRLLDRHPLPFRDPAGTMTGKITVQLPLENAVKIEDIAVHAQAHLEQVHAGDLVAGHSLENATLDLAASNDGMQLEGAGLLAGIAAQFSAEMDFRAGPPAQVLQKASVSGTATAAQLATFGLGAGQVLAGSVAIQATLTEQRSGRGALAAAADLTQAELSAAPLEWHKPAGAPARGSATVVLDHDKLAGVEAIALEGRDLSLHAAAHHAEGGGSTLSIDRIVLGRTQAQGIVRFPPPGSGRPIQASVSGSTLDVSATMERSNSGPAKPLNPTPGPAWIAEARFDRALVAGGGAFTGLTARAENDGRIFTRLRVDGSTAPGAPFRLEIAPERGGRRLTASAADAGGLLRGLDVTRTMQGGRLTVSGNYDDRRVDHPLSGEAEITDFRVRDPNGLGRLLQAMTLYGLVQAASGPGLGFSRLIAPFTLTDNALDLGECRAFSPSLGLTAKGRIDLARQVADVQGTIIPAYFFNSLLGEIPVIGRLFSPEKGGGLFAASYTVRGPVAEPQITVNPLSALTPGFLRGLFQGF